MFDNLLAQDEVRSILSADIESGRLPPTLLFSGPPASGKMTAALELARALGCTRSESGERAAWNCGCASCVRHRVLAHPDLLLFGGRSFPEELPAAVELLARSPGKASAFFFVRAVRKLLRRFDAPLFAGEESKLAKAAPLVREVEESLEAMSPSGAPAEGSTADETQKAAAKIAAACAKLEPLVADAPPVFMVRNAELWARLAPLGERKIVILENADRLQEAARNALLKILEEPPESVRFVLLSSRRGSVMATILSRCRSYSFKRRSREDDAMVIERVFRSSEPAVGVESFLAARRSFPPAEARERAQAFLAAAIAERPDANALAPPLAALARTAAGEGLRGAESLARLLEATMDFGAKDGRFASSFRSFLEALAGTLGDLLREEGMDAGGTALVASWAAAARQARLDNEAWNRSPSLLAETLLYEIGGRA